MIPTNPQDKNSRFLLLVSVLSIVAALYFARDVVIPLALALLLAFLLAPLAAFLERLHLPRVLAVSLVVALAISVIGAVGWMATSQVADLAGNLPEYRGEVQRKIRLVRERIGGGLGNARDAVRSISEELRNQPIEQVGPRAEPPRPVEVVAAPSSPFDTLKGMLGPLFEFVATGVIVIFLVVFMLVGREDLRDRMLRLAGGGRLQLTTQAMDDAAGRVSRYLVAQVGINGSYGLAVGIGLWLIGIPNAALWGLLAGALRFLPYVGPWMGAAAPMALSLVVFQTWTPVVLTVVLYLVLEIIAANVVEPWLYGATAGVSPMAVLVGAVFWTWLWGGVGLLLATPLTVCLVVLGKYVPQLAFLNVLLGDEPVFEPKMRYYQRLLAGKRAEARSVVAEQARAEGLDVFDALVLPAIALAELDRRRGDLGPAGARAVWKAIREDVEELPGLFPEDSDDQFRLPGAELGILCLPASGEAADEAASVAAAQYLTLRHWNAWATSGSALGGEMFDLVQRGGIDAVLVSSVAPSEPAHARYLGRRLRARFPEMPLMLGVWMGKAETGSELAEWDPSVTVVDTLGAAGRKAQQLAEQLLLEGERRKEPEVQPGQPISNPPPGRVRRPLVLVVDDDEDLRAMTRLVVEAQGYGAIVGADGDEGLALAHVYKPDLVVTDALMPGMDGRDMCRAIKDDPELGGVKVFVATALYRGERYKVEAHRDFGVDEYLTKPVDNTELAKLLRKYLGAPPAAAPARAAQ